MNMLDVHNFGYDRGRAVDASIEVPQEGEEYQIVTGERVVIRDFWDARAVMLDRATQAEQSSEINVPLGLSESALAGRPSWRKPYQSGLVGGILTEVEDRLSVAGY